MDLNLNHSEHRSVQSYLESLHRMKKILEHIILTGMQCMDYSGPDVIKKVCDAMDDKLELEKRILDVELHGELSVTYRGKRKREH